MPLSPVSFHRNQNTERGNELLLEEQNVFMRQTGYVLKYCWEERGSLGGFTLWGGRAELCQWALTHNRVVKGELKKFVQWNKELR